MYPEAVAHETFMAGVEEVRAHPETYEEYVHLFKKACDMRFAPQINLSR